TRNKIPFSIRPRHAGVQAMIVIQPAESSKKHFLMIRLIISVLVRIHNHGGRTGYNHLISDYRNTQWRYDIFILDKYFRTVGFAISVYIFQNKHTISGRMG